MNNEKKLKICKECQMVVSEGRTYCWNCEGEEFTPITEEEIVKRVESLKETVGRTLKGVNELCDDYEFFYNCLDLYCATDEDRDFLYTNFTIKLSLERENHE